MNGRLFLAAAALNLATLEPSAVVASAPKRSAAVIAAAENSRRPAPGSNAGQAIDGAPIVIGNSYILTSKILGNDRRLNVWLPPSYFDGNRDYPVLILLDGGVTEDFLHIAGLAQITSAYGQGQELIVVGVEGVDRRHDLSPPTSDPDDLRFTKVAGGAGQYRRFLTEELKPWINAHYRTNGRSGLIGESLAGLFVLEALVRMPEAFNDYIAVSPSLAWDRQSLSRTLSKGPPATGPERRVFIAFEGSMAVGPTGPTAAQQAEARVESALHNRPNATVVRFAEERHGTIYHPAALSALRKLYAVATRP